MCVVASRIRGNKKEASAMSKAIVSNRALQETIYGRTHLVHRVIPALLAALFTAVPALPIHAQSTSHPAKSATGSAAASHTTDAATAVPGVVDITLERQRGTKVETMAPGHVFDKGDVIRLKVTSHYDGFLYVMDQGTSGKFATVFPGMQTGSDNRVRMAGQYLVPADGWFEVDGPGGFDVLYFLLSPTPLSTPSVSSFAAPGPVSSLKPRCNDEIFRARGDCTDDSAGPAAVPRDQDLPAPLAPIAGSASRDITFINKPNGTVGVQGESRAPMLYTFRLAHL
jgi:hypothetical protein